MATKRVLVFLLVPFFGLLRFAGPNSQRGSSQETKSQALLRHDVTVTPKLVQVVVTDEKGNPATGIRKDEFVLYDNGEEKKITEFERHSLSIPAPSPPADKRVETTPVLTNPLLNRKFLFLFDFVFAEGKGFRIGKEATLRFIESNLASADEAGIISFSGARNLCVHQFFTKDHLAVRKAIESLSIQNLLQVALVNTEES